MQLPVTGSQFEFTSPEAMEAFASELAKSLPAPFLLALNGDLGAGKTTFVRGFASGLQCHDEASSPTFSILQIYAGEQPLVHCDWYRIERESELTRIGWDELVDTEERIIVEWAERFPRLLPKNAKVLRFTIEGEKRIVTAEAGW